MLHFTEKIEPLKILTLLSRSLPYYLESWKDIDSHNGLFGSIDPSAFNMRSVGSSSPVIEYVLRPHLNITIILAVYHFLHEEAIIGSIIDKKEIINKIQKATRWACETHLTGTHDVETFLERKRWGENWRSSIWASQLGLIYLFCNDIFNDKTKKAIKRVLAFEADRFIDLSPPTGCAIDTKVEENAHDVMLLAWAINLVPDHPNRIEWEKSLILWSVNIASSIHDKTDHDEFYSSSIAQMVSTQNLFPDMTAESNGFFHPEIFTYGSWIILALSAYVLNKVSPPDFLFRKNHRRTFDILLRFCLPNGLIFTPAGNEMPMFIPQPMALAWGLWHNEARAMHLTGKLLSWMDTQLRGSEENPGPWVFGLSQCYEGWELFFQSQVGFELALLASIPFSKEQRTLSPGQIENALDTRHIYPYIEICYRRNLRSTRSVAWKGIGNHPLISINVHRQAELIAPFKAAFLGIPSCTDPIKSWNVAFHHDQFQKDGFDTSGRIEYFNKNGTRLLYRDIRVLTWDEDGMLIFDTIFADFHVEINEQYLSPIYLVNDIWTDYECMLNSGSLRDAIRSSYRKMREISCPSSWASINNQFLFQFIWGRTKGLYFLPGGERNAPPYWKNCRVDMLAVHVDDIVAESGMVIHKVGYFIGSGKGPRPFKSTGTAGEFYKGLVIMDGKKTIGLT